MATVFQVILFSLLGDVIALGAGALLIARQAWAENLARYATPFAAGALLAAAFIDLLPEAVVGDARLSLLGALVGILFFFLLERFLHWFHHHHHDETAPSNHQHRDAKIPLIIIGNLLHRAIDGVAIAAGFLVSPAAGIVVTAAIVAHETPHTIGDFGLLLYKKMPRGRVILVNVAIALLTTAVAAGVFLLGQSVAIPLGVVLGLTAGFFIYIAVSDIIPDIHVQEDKKFIGLQSALLIFGVILVGFLIEMIETIL